MATTTNMIAVAHESEKGSCFLVRPAPGNRRTDVIPTKQISDIEDMLFVSNEHILVQFKNKAFVTFNADGTVQEQNEEVRQHLDNEATKLAESALENDNKYVAFLCNESNGPTIVVLYFRKGRATVVAKIRQ